MIHYKYADADGHRIYREAGPPSAPTILLFTAFPLHRTCSAT